MLRALLLVAAALLAAGCDDDDPYWGPEGCGDVPECRIGTVCDPVTETCIGLPDARPDAAPPSDGSP